jgi:hypothetical protein
LIKTDKPEVYKSTEKAWGNKAGFTATFSNVKVMASGKDFLQAIQQPHKE